VRPDDARADRRRGGHDAGHDSGLRAQERRDLLAPAQPDGGQLVGELDIVVEQLDEPLPVLGVEDPEQLRQGLLGLVDAQAATPPFRCRAVSSRW
jgi:hypothetical protein